MAAIVKKSKLEVRKQYGDMHGTTTSSQGLSAKFRPCGVVVRLGEERLRARVAENGQMQDGAPSVMHRCRSQDSRRRNSGKLGQRCGKKADRQQGACLSLAPGSNLNSLSVSN